MKLKYFVIILLLFTILNCCGSTKSETSEKTTTTKKKTTTGKTTKHTTPTKTTTTGKTTKTTKTSTTLKPTTTKPGPPGPIRNTTFGKVEGIAMKNANVYLGIPFAQPPVGKLRFQVPKSVKHMRVLNPLAYEVLQRQRNGNTVNART